MFKLYFPSGHLEQASVNLFKEMGMKISISHRSCTPKIENFDIPAKIIRPWDAPMLLSLGKADAAITGSDILKEFLLSNPSQAGNLSILLDLPILSTRLVLAISNEIFPLVTTLPELLSQLRKQGKTEIVIASKYPATTKKFFAKRGISAIRVFTPSGQTESWIIPPNPEADLICEITETGKTLSENNCKIIEQVQENYPILAVNRASAEDQSKKQFLDDFAIQARRAVYKIREKDLKLKQAQLPLPELKARPIPASS